VAEYEPDRGDLQRRYAGVLLGTAIGDALGLPMEGMGPKAIARTFPTIDRYALLGETGFVSDDTEQTALVAQSIARHPADLQSCLRSFRRSLFGWFLRLPWGIGWGTLKACVKIGLGLRNTGTSSAGNGAAMRAAIVGAFHFDNAERRRQWSDGLARVTHADLRAVEGARFVAELASSLVKRAPSDSLEVLVVAAAAAVEQQALRAAISTAARLASEGRTLEEAVPELGNTGFVVHTVAIATFCFLRHGSDPEAAIVSAIRAGGDTDSNAAIVGAWVGALHGELGLPKRLIDNLNDGPFGRTHLRQLAADLEVARSGTPATTASYSVIHSLLRNLALYPVVLAHAVRVAVRGSR
jgi:ADP-ribosylglycohydrolase